MYVHLLQVYTGSYRQQNTTTRNVINVEDLNMIEKGQLVALNVENCDLRPLIARVTDVDDDTMDVLWLDGGYNKAWKIAKKREGRAMVDWVDSVPKSSVILFDFQLTSKNRLRKATIEHLKEAYNKIDS